LRPRPPRRQVVTAAGGKLKDVYLVTGEYELIVITEAPSDEVPVTRRRWPCGTRCPSADGCRRGR